MSCMLHVRALCIGTTTPLDFICGLASCHACRLVWYAQCSCRPPLLTRHTVHGGDIAELGTAGALQT